MSANVARSALTAVALSLTGGCSSPTATFLYRPEIAASGTMYRYLKTNLDGSHPGEIALFVSSPDSLESFKYSAGGSEFSLVTATMSWTTFSPGTMGSWRARAGGDRKQVASLRFDEASRVLDVDLSGTVEQLPIPAVPWHSYDFDFASLNVAFRHLVDPRRPFLIEIVDPSYQDSGPAIVHKGSVEIRYLGDEQRGGVATRKYRIEGPGLSNRGGFLWVDAEAGHLVEFEIEVGDEPGYNDVRMRLIDLQPMDRVRWAAFIESQFTGSAPPRT